ncbi:hypothetical protein [Flavobacterium sp.]|uniref:hypothetical protein n=1 Tax=Flavobacterium sp. TaxID=239 RepID=UPI00260D8D53|nr:hypothetical protein [Flavobacterium sp.]
MRVLNYFILLIFICNSKLLFAQQVKGNLVNYLGVSLKETFIVAKLKSNETFQLKTKTDSLGNFKFFAFPKNDTISLWLVRRSGLEFLHRFYYDKSKTYQLELTASNNEEQPEILEEVKIQTKQSPVKIKGDTTKFKIANIIDGSEKVLEDVLVKLPGVKISDNGAITFKGKAISTILIDGQNLFDHAYQTGSKNISSELIAQIEAIENYTQNSVLSSFDKGTETVLNVNLQKNGADYFGTIDIGGGIKNRFKLKATNFVTNANIKLFTVHAWNNVNENAINTDALDNQMSNLANTNVQVIPNLRIASTLSAPLSDSKYVIDEALIANSASFVSKIRNHKLRVQLSQIHKTASLQNETSLILTGENPISISTSTQNNATIKAYNGQINWVGRSTKNVYFESNTLFNAAKNQLLIGGDNNGIKQNLENSPTNFGASNITQLSLLLGEGMILDSKTYVSIGSTKENTSITNPSESANFSNFILNEQNTNTKLFNAGFKSELLYKKNQLLVKVPVDLQFSQQNFDTSFETSQIQNPLFVAGNGTYTYTIGSASPNFKVSSKTFSVNAGTKVSIFTRAISETTTPAFKRSDFLVEPFIQLNTLLNSKSKIIAMGQINRPIIPLNHAISLTRLQGFRNLTTFNLAAEIPRNYNANLSYNYHNFYTATYLTAQLSHTQSNYNFIPYFDFTNSYQLIRNIQQRLGSTVSSFTNDLDTYIPWLKSSLKTTFSASKSKNYIAINSTEVLPNEGTFYSSSIGLKFANKKRNIRLETQAEFSKSSFDFSGMEQSQIGLNYSVKLHYNFQKKLFFRIENNYWRPDLSIKDAFSFLDFSTDYSFKKHKIDIGLTGRNILNVKSISMRTIDNTGSMTFQTNTIGRIVLFFVRFEIK